MSEDLPFPAMARHKGYRELAGKLSFPSKVKSLTTHLVCRSFYSLSFLLGCGYMEERKSEMEV